MGELLVNLLQVVKRTSTSNTSTNGVVDRPCFFWVVGSNPTSTIQNFIRLSPYIWHVELENTLPGGPVSPGNETAWILIRPPVHPADLLSRRFRGEMLKGLVWISYRLTFCKWSNGLIPH